MNPLFERLKQSELPYLSKAFAKFLHEQSEDNHDTVLLAGAFVSHQLNKGDVYLDLNAFFKAKEKFNDIDITALTSYFVEDWETHFSNSTVISNGEGNSPLVWIKTKTHNRLYLRRYWEYQNTVYNEIKNRLASIRPNLPETITAQLNELFPISDITPDWQKIACAVALRANFSIITGGPGTGKTTTLSKLLVLLVSLLRLEKGDSFKPEILLAAPTGKAANRVSESIKNALEKLETVPDDIKNLIPKEAKTIHRLLGSRPDTRLYKQNKNNPLIVDILIIDEASMIDLEMMAALLEALPENTQLILLGDKDQLSSVEAGHVFGNLCKGAGKAAYDKNTLNWISNYADGNFSTRKKALKTSLINQQTVKLIHSYRFDAKSGIGQLAKICNTRKLNITKNIISGNRIFEKYNDLDKITNFEQLKKVSFKNYEHYLNEINQNRAKYATPDKWAVSVLKAFDKFRILTAIHETDCGVQALNNKVQTWLFPNEIKTWFEGRPVMITKNDYNLGLMNGDIGIALNLDGKLKVAFFGNDQAEKIRWFSTSRISDVQTAFALTVHKSQGSEFEHTLFVLPNADENVLKKELFYTAITRAKNHFTLNSF